MFLYLSSWKDKRFFTNEFKSCNPNSPPPPQRYRFFYQFFTQNMYFILKYPTNPHKKYSNVASAVPFCYNKYKKTSNLTKFQSFALHKRNEKIYRKPHHTLLNTALERLDSQAKQKVYYDSPGSLITLKYFRFLVLSISHATLKYKC